MTMTTAAAAPKAAALLLEAWRDPARTIPHLPEELRPADLAQAYAIQEAVVAGLGAIGGWKVGAPGPDAPPTCAPMPVAGLHNSPAHLPAARYSLRTVEAEVCFLLGQDLPAYDAPFSREQVIAAIDSCHPGIEVLQSRFTDPDAVDPLTALADSLSHGAYVYGPHVPDWQKVDFAREEVRLLIEEDAAVTRTANPAGDMIRLIEWLANAGAHWAGGLMAGQVITTGSWTGKTLAPAGVPVRARFAHLGEARVDFV